MENKRKELTDEEWDLIEALIPLIGKEKEWEVSRDRHHKRCLWEREEDAPFVLEEAIKAIKEAVGERNVVPGLPEDKFMMLTGLFKEFM